MEACILELSLGMAISAIVNRWRAHIILCPPWFFDGTPGKPVLFSRGSKAVANMCLLVGSLVAAVGPQLAREQAQQGFLDRE